VMIPIPEKDPAGIVTVQSPAVITPPRSPFTVLDTSKVVDERREELDPVPSPERLWFGAALCSGARGEVEHPASRTSARNRGRAAMRVLRGRLTIGLSSI
jgi:hypothetical protein